MQAPVSPLASRAQALRKEVGDGKLMDREDFVWAFELMVASFRGQTSGPFWEEMHKAEERLLSLRSLLAGAQTAAPLLKADIKTLEQQLDLPEAELKAEAEGKNEKERQVVFLRARASSATIKALEEQIAEKRRRLVDAEGELALLEREWAYLAHVLEDRRLLLAFVTGVRV